MSGDKGKVVAGVFIGMVLGIAAAGAVAWFVLKKNPTAFINKEPSKPAPQVAAVPASAPAVVAPVAASGVGEPKQHFEFYKELTDKSDGTAHKSSPKPAVKPPVAPRPAQPPAAASKEVYYVQAGSFQNIDDAEKLKAKLAFSGFEATLQTVNLPDKGVWHRVRLGPYNSNEAGRTVATLKQNGIIATQQRAQ
ncbi:cell division protein FtsN [Sideroxyarcus emersonii]|uniref:Cell division protein FtsN n=1 Tax=Sideroxyarcus emersonii TaxID=2764705 RepID=A0AAN2BXL7_9PROT|nr:SPOR domain-containing protein [Sideroxyarcus emersonii]BCK86350.1 cell division protein FtsN [Sideroxyarcus emersonii]